MAIIYFGYRHGVTLEIVGDGSPVNEASNITALSSKITITKGTEYTSKDTGDKYVYLDNGGNTWRKLSHGPS